MATYLCRTEAEVLDTVEACVANAETIEVVGHASKRGWGRAASTDHVLDLSELSGITLYEPDELVLSAKAGTSMLDIERTLTRHGQQLAFEPMDAGPIFGRAPGGGTIGGVLAANLSGPARIRAGAARDHVLGIRAVSGWGRAFKSGGRVVKNVTGYDLSRGLAGSWGTLAVLTDLTFKVIPRPETSATLAVLDLDDAAAIALLCDAMGSPWEVSGAAHVPAGTSGALPGAAFAGGRAVTLLRLEGFAESVRYRMDRLADRLGLQYTREVLDASVSVPLWCSVRDVLAFTARDCPLWRVSVAPGDAARLVATIRSECRLQHFYDWSGGLTWLQPDRDMADLGAAAIRRAVSAAGGHATLVRGGNTSDDIARFQPQSDVLAALSARLKSSLDPKGILNPGRMS